MVFLRLSRQISGQELEAGHECSFPILTHSEFNLISNCVISEVGRAQIIFILFTVCFICFEFRQREEYIPKT